MKAYLDELWCHIVVDAAGVILSANNAALRVVNRGGLTGQRIDSVLPWLKFRWLSDSAVPRLVKTSIADKVLLDIIAEPAPKETFHIYFRRYNDYADMDHLWCEVADSIIGVQKFIDTSYDGMAVADGEGKVLAVNEAFVHISGLRRETIVGRKHQDLLDEKIVPHSCTLQTLQTKQTCSSVIKYFNGKEAVVSATPLTDPMGRIIRVIANVRDLSDLNTLHEKLKNAKALVKGFQRELSAIQAASADANRGLIRSRQMENLYELVHKVASTDLQLLITGESGVGKTALAKYVHMAGDRSKTGNFVHVNCSAIPEMLLESELFGHEEGSFTGARRSKAGLFELADRGTLFLDEIGEMPLSLQAKLLNVLQEGKFYRVGGLKEIATDVRIIAATNSKLETLIARGRFRQDLFYRLNVIPIRIPSLSERHEDIPPLIAHYLDKCNSRYKKNKTIVPEAMDVLLKYTWPGNIRELMNLIERIVVILDEPVIEVRHLLEVAENTELMHFLQASARTGSVPGQKLWQPDRNLKDIVKSVEEDVIEQAIAGCGSLKEAARSLGVDVTTIIRKRAKKARRDIAMP